MVQDFHTRNLQALRRKKADILESRKDDASVEKARALFWANHYHRNSRGEPMTFDRMGYLTQLYVLLERCPYMVVEKSVQMGISELFIIQSHIEAGERGWTVMYVLPKYESRNRFVNNRVWKLHKTVPHYAELLKSATATVHRAGLIHFGKGTMTFAGSNVETEFLEIPVDSAYVDEKDRCTQSNLLLLPDRYSASPYGYHREISNPTIEGFGIDERYQKSTQGVWEIKCEGCGQWFNPDFFQHVIEETGATTFRVRDPEWEQGKEPRLMHSCGKSTDRLADGRWTEQFKGRTWRGFRISRVFGKYATLSGLVDEWGNAIGNPREVQIFFNSRLGLPYSSEGAQIRKETLNTCRRAYRYPAIALKADNPRYMGVDIGKVLNVIIRERIVEEGKPKLRLIEACTVPTYEALSRMIREWQPRKVVVDADPELHKNDDLKLKHHNVFTSRFQLDRVKMTINTKDRHITMDRTSAIDAVHQGFVNQDLLLPMEGEQIFHGDYYKHITAEVRTLETDEDTNKSRFVWQHTRDDHFLLAEVYCLQAAASGGSESIFEFFASHAEYVKEGRKTELEKETALVNVDVERAVELDQLSQQTPDQALARVRETHLRPTMKAPKVNDRAIQRTINILWKQEQYVDVKMASGMSGELVDDVVRILKVMGFRQSRIEGQWVH